MDRPKVEPTKWKQRFSADVGLHKRALDTLNAVALIQLGARVPLICKLTGLERSTARRLYQETKGFTSPSGQAPFTDQWYLKNDLRWLHATIIWHLYQACKCSSNTPARILIDLYDTYTNIVHEVLLDITRAAFVPQLVALGLWVEYRCNFCGLKVIGPVHNHSETCPACRLYHRYRCQSCGAAIEKHAAGRYRKTCKACAHGRKRRGG